MFLFYTNLSYSSQKFMELQMQEKDFENFSDDSADELEWTDYRTFGEAVLYGTDWTAKTIIQQIKDGNIDLSPDFQRRDAWSLDTKSRFIESVILQIPIPQIVLAESKEQRGKFIVLDGKQRLITLSQFAGELDTNHPFNSLLKNNEPLKLGKLDILKDLNGIRYADLCNSYPQLRMQFDNHSIRSALIRNWPSDDYLYEVFIRLNTGSAKLSPQELRQAMKPGKFTEFLSRKSAESEGLKLILGLDKPDFRMRDVDILLRLIAFNARSKLYSGNLKKFLDETHEFYNKNWDTEEAYISNLLHEINSGIDFLIYKFETPKLVGRKYEISDNNFGKNINRALLDVQVSFAISQNNRTALANEDLKKITIESCSNEDFYQAISSTTKSISSFHTRYGIRKSKLPTSIINPTVF